ncbi:phosphocholine cytidylyltransferase family protein [Halarcobacter bivalviorum]|uniref:phosphocholine cytidylyltransferase family protein n=1 Tax=Halarcobacter bivalviorum TaxID=663364 RepID=UPI00100A3900|nr:phosphocholine cytidylyltransferase family protein [Halarcobacter bivalviorum]RXK05042.1 sugar nucleotidyltransferase [Halarcobacter bivalviorum]
MKLIILAAGQGTRLRPLTNNIPKCMVKYQDKPLIDYILEVTKDIEKRYIVTGYKSEVLKEYLKEQNLTFIYNKDYNKTNMVTSLFCAKEFMNDDLIISYSDIIYKKEVIEKLIKSKYDISVVVDKQWKKLWLQRMQNPLDDAETLKIKDNKIIELGKKTKDYSEIEGQYIGLIKISKNTIQKILAFYNNLSKDRYYDNKDFDNMYLTSFIQLIIDNLYDVNPIFINGSWLEVDCIEDLNTKMI